MAKRTKRPGKGDFSSDVLTSAKGPEPGGEATEPEAPPAEPEAPKAAERAAESLTPAPTAPPAVEDPDVRPGDLKLSARQFVRARKLRWERAAGFLLSMKTLGPQVVAYPPPAKKKKGKLGAHVRLTVRQWQKEWDAFWTRPVGPTTPRQRRVK